MNEKGQTTVEYSVMLAFFLLIALLLVVLLSAMNDYGLRIISLVGLDYP
jgi:Flp pilus assembly pilin Flp